MTDQDLLLTRRSVRKFTDAAISMDGINTILKAAMYAPTAANKREHVYIVTQNPDSIKKMALFPHWKPALATANTVIVVCGDVRLELRPGDYVISGGAVSQNILLSAHDLGIGGVWLAACGVAEHVDFLTSFFNLPEYIKPFSVIVLGYPAEPASETPDRFDLGKIFWEKYR